MYGVHVAIRHKAGCNATGTDYRRCRCAPGVRAQVAKVWVIKGRTLAKGWGRAELEQLEDEARALKRDHESGRKIIARRRPPTVRELYERWIVRIEREVQDLEKAPNTLVRYRSDWSCHLSALAEKPVVELTPEFVDDFRRELRRRLARTHADNIMASLSSMLRPAIPEWLIVNPVAASGGSHRGSRRAELVRRRPRALPDDMVAALLAADDGLLGDMILCALTTGMRQREVAGLRLENIDPRNRRIAVAGQLLPRGGVWWPFPKGIDYRVVPMCSALADRLAARAEHVAGAYVFEAPKFGMPWSGPRQSELLRAAWERVGGRGDREGWHAFRHTFKTLLDREEIRPRVIDAILGHEDSHVSARYNHPLDREFDVVAAVLDRVFVADGSVVRYTPGDTVPESAEVSRESSRPLA